MSYMHFNFVAKKKITDENYSLYLNICHFKAYFKAESIILPNSDFKTLFTWPHLVTYLFFYFYLVKDYLVLLIDTANIDCVFLFFAINKKKKFYIQIQFELGKMIKSQFKIRIKMTYSEGCILIIIGLK